MNPYRTNRRFGDLFMDEAKKVLGLFVCVPANLNLDTQHATDFTIIQVNPHIAFRVRETKYQEKYGNQFTIRYQVPSGQDTEFQKIMQGKADWLLYCFGEENPFPHFTKWTLLDLSAFRYHMTHNQDQINWGVRCNNDGSQLAWFDITSFPTDYPLIIGQSK